MLARTPGPPFRHPVCTVAVAALLALSLAPALEAQQGEEDLTEADVSAETTFPAVRPAIFARLGPALDFDGGLTMVGTAGGGADIAFSRRLGVRLDGEVLLSLASGSVAFAGAPAGVVYLGEDAPNGSSLRAGPLIWTSIGDEFTSARVLGPFVSLSVPIGDAGVRFETSATLITPVAVLFDLGLGWTLP